jgi:hypothetical protein
MCLFLPVACANAPAPTPSADAEVEPAEEANLGVAQQALDTQGFFQARGFFTNLDTVAGDCVVAADGTDTISPIQAPNAGGQEVTFSLALIESSSDLQKNLSVSASASAKFLVGGGDAKFKFAEETHTTDTTATLLASVVVRNTSWTAPPGVRLRDDVLPLLRGVAGKPPSAAQLARFRARCGDGFIQSYTTGGEFRAIIQVQTSSKDEKNAVSASMAGHYLTFSASADFENELHKIVSSSSTLVRTYQIGGEKADTAACADISCVTDRIKSFTSAVATKPIVIDQAVKSYKLLALPNDAVVPGELAATLDLMATINAQRNSTRDLLARLVDVQTNSENYVLGASTLSDVTTAISTLNSNMNTLNNALKVCGRTPNSCAAPTLASVSVTVPEVKPLPTRVMIRGYGRPSYFLVDGGGVKNCSGAYIRIGDVETRADADLAAFKIVPALNGAVGAISLQNELTKLPLKVNIANTCYGWTQFSAATTATTKDNASFYRVKGLNGRPNTWSFRLYGAGEAYLALTKYVPIRLTTPPDGTDPVAMDAFKDNASWYVDAM